MCEVFVDVRFFKKFGCPYNQSGLLKIEILLLLRLAKFKNTTYYRRAICLVCSYIYKILYSRAPSLALRPLGRVRRASKGILHTKGVVAVQP